MKNEVKIWVTTDTHFGHEKIKEYCHRPEDFEDRILKGLEVVGEEDILIHLGDFCWEDNEEWHKKFFKAVKARRTILVRGNHDNKKRNWYMAHGWSFTCNWFLSKYFGKTILFSHMPAQALGISKKLYDINVHGHSHDSGSPDHHGIVYKKRWKQKLVSIENLGYKPILLKTLLGQ